LKQLTLGYYFNQNFDLPFNMSIIKLDCNW
jgi:hypothetical protein